MMCPKKDLIQEPKRFDAGTPFGMLRAACNEDGQHTHKNTTKKNATGGKCIPGRHMHHGKLVGNFFLNTTCASYVVYAGRRRTKKEKGH
jgi:hypothetical protein